MHREYKPIAAGGIFAITWKSLPKNETNKEGSRTKKQTPNKLFFFFKLGQTMPEAIHHHLIWISVTQNQKETINMGKGRLDGFLLPPQLIYLS